MFEISNTPASALLRSKVAPKALEEVLKGLHLASSKASAHLKKFVTADESPNRRAGTPSSCMQAFPRKYPVGGELI